MKKRIIITGGAGYIGSHTAKALFDNGYEVVVFDNLVYGHQEFVKWGPLELVDLLKDPDIRERLEKYAPIHGIMHFAAYAYVGESMSNPEKYYRNNIIGSLNLFEAAKELKISNIVFSSTCATYGSPKEMPMSEKHPQNPVNPYGFTKLAIERLLKDMKRAYGIHAISLRYFNAAGADPSPQPGFAIGEDHNPETHLIPLIFDAATGKREYIGVFGTDYHTEDGTAIRDYIHVNDIADAHVLALKYMENGGESNLFNLGNGKGFSVKEVIQRAQEVIGVKYPIKVKEEARRRGDPEILISDSTKVTELLGWQPRYPKIEEILEHAWKWYRFRFLDS